MASQASGEGGAGMAGVQVLMYGASTAVGRAIVSACALLGHRVVAADASWVGDQAGTGVRAVRVALDDSRALHAALAGCDVVVLALYDARPFTAFGPTSRYSDAARAFRGAAPGVRIAQCFTVSKCSSNSRALKDNFTANNFISKTFELSW